jgi:hypothetical protein
MVDNSGTNGAEYVIQRASESRCEWWTGAGWSEDETDALRYAGEPHPGGETGDESATVLPFTSGRA